MSKLKCFGWAIVVLVCAFVFALIINVIFAMLSSTLKFIVSGAFLIGVVGIAYIFLNDNYGEDKSEY